MHALLASFRPCWSEICTRLRSCSVMHICVKTFQNILSIARTNLAGMPSLTAPTMPPHYGLYEIASQPVRNRFSDDKHCQFRPNGFAFIASKGFKPGTEWRSTATRTKARLFDVSKGEYSCQFNESETFFVVNVFILCTNAPVGVSVAGAFGGAY